MKHAVALYLFSNFQLSFVILSLYNSSIHIKIRCFVVAYNYSQREIIV